MYKPTVGLGCVECGGTCGGKNKGLGSIDLSTLSWEDYLLLGAGVMVVYSLASPDSRLFNPAPKRKKRAKKSSGMAGSLIASAVVLGGAYLGYRYLSSDLSGGGVVL